MKLNIVLLVLPLLASLGLLWLVNLRRKEHARQQKRNRFQDIKLRVTGDVFGEYREEVAKAQTLLDQTRAEIQRLESESVDLLARAKERASLKDSCVVDNQRITAELGAAEVEVNSLRAELTKEKSSWETEAASLKEQLSQRSKVCDFIKKDSSAARKLCEADVVQESKVAETEAPKQEEAKAEEPKKEESKAEEPKKEEPKAEEPKAEAPKQEEPKVEAPKQEEAAKQEEPKA